MKKLIILFTLALCTGFTFAQYSEVEFFHLSVEQGLSQSTVYSIVQDDLGYMWIGTQSGLNMFDGTRVTEFSADATNPLNIPNDNINSILPLKDGRLFLGTWDGGIVVLNKKTGKFTQFLHDKKNPNSLSFNRIQTMCEAKNGILWIGTGGGGLNAFNPATMQFDAYHSSDSNQASLWHDRIWDIEEDQSGKIWVATYFGFNSVDPQTKKVVRYSIPAAREVHENSNYVRALKFDRNGKLWLGTQHGIYIFEPSTGKFEHILLDPTPQAHFRFNTINCFLEMPDGSMLVGTYANGLYHISTERRIIAHYTHDEKVAHSLAENDIRCIIRDRSGLLWIATRGGGVNTTQLTPPRFTSVTGEPWKTPYVPGRHVRSMYATASGNIYVGTINHGLHVFNPARNEIRPIKALESGTNISNARVLSLCADSSNIWCITDEEVYKVPIDQTTATPVRFPGTGHLPFPTDYARSIEVLNNRFVWIGTYGRGLYEFDILKNKWTNYTSKNCGLQGNEINSLMLYKNDLWICTNNGLTKFDLRSRLFTTYGTDSAKASILRNRPLWSISTTRDGKLICGGSVGLVIFDPNTAAINQIWRQQGIDENEIYAAIEDDNQQIWISGIKGFWRYNVVTSQLLAYDQYDGVMPNVFNAGCVVRAGKDLLAFGGINGIVLFRPSHLKINQFIPPVLITRIKIYDNSKPVMLAVPTNPRIADTTFELSYLNNTIDIEFAALNYLYPGKNKFRYKMEGIDAQWREGRQVGSVSYPGLPPGKYIFQVLASNNDDIWNKTGAKVTFIILPPFYARWYFQLVFAALLVTVIIYLYMQRVNNFRKMQSILEMTVASRTEELKKSESELKKANSDKDKLFSIIAHDLRSPFQSLISISNLLNTEYDEIPDEDKKMMLHRIESSTRSTFELLDNLLTWSKTQSNRIEQHPELMPVRNIIQRHLGLISHSASLKNISLKTEIAEKAIVFADMIMLGTVIRNLLTNAVKFTPDGGQITISSKSDNDICTITISDSGVGIPKDTLDHIFDPDKLITTRGTRGEKGSGLGLLLCKEFVTLNQGQLTVSSEPGKGTTFMIVLPAIDSTNSQSDQAPTSSGIA